AYLENYQSYLLKNTSYSNAWTLIKDLKAYLRIAYKKDKLPVDTDYQRHFMSKPESDPVWLEEDEVNALFSLYQGGDSREETRRDLRAFLFACFTGLRISDLKQFNKNWVVGDELVFQPEKGLITKQ